MAVITFLGATTTYTVEQALQHALSRGEFIQEVIVIGWNEKDELYVGSSRMTRKDALWLLEQAKLRTLDINGYQDDRSR